VNINGKEKSFICVPVTYTIIYCAFLFKSGGIIHVILA